MGKHQYEEKRREHQCSTCGKWFALEYMQYISDKKRIGKQRMVCDHCVKLPEEDDK